MPKLDFLEKNNLINGMRKNKLFFGASVLGIFYALSPCFAFAEPRAVIEINTRGELLDKLKAAVGDVPAPAQSVYEARKRASLAETYATELLRSEGYYESSITSDVSDGENPKAILKIDIGPIFKISKSEINWDGTPPNAPTQNSANAAIGLKPNAPARAQDVLDAEARILGAVLSQGYANATTLPKKIIVDHADFTLSPTFIIAAGEIVKFGDLNLEGKSKVNAKWLEKISPIKRGQNFDPKALATLERRLLDTGAFDAVNIALAPKDNENNQRNINVTLQDRARFHIETDLSYSTNEGVAFEGRLARYNLLGRADTLINRLVYGEIEKRIEGEWRLPHFRAPDQTLAVSLGAFIDDTRAYREKGIETKAEITRKLSISSFWTVGLDANIARTREPSFLNPADGIERDYQSINALGAFLFDKTDNYLNPRTGYKADFRIEPTLITGDASLTYVKMVGQASYYKSFGKYDKNVIAARARMGSILGGKIPELPSGKRLYSGGGGSVRGFEYQSIGPHYNDISNTPVGGLSLIEAGLEYRRDLGNKFGIVAFVDSGTLGINSTPDFKEFRVGVGLGLRYDLGFAPLRIDIGVPIKHPNGTSSYQFYVGVGQSF